MNIQLVRAVIVCDGCLLVARTNGADYVFLPGGHVEKDEYLDEALTREMKEELTLSCQTGDYLGFVEHRWSESGASMHEVNHCFAVSAVRGAAAPESREAHLTFEWVPLQELAGRNLKPPALVSLITRYFAGDRRTWAVSRL